MATSIDQQFVEYVVKSLVNNPDAVQIERRIDEKGVLLELTVDAEDLGRVIGKRGATAQSLRTLLRALGTKNEARYHLKIVDVDRPESERGYSQPPSAQDGDTGASQGAGGSYSSAADDGAASDSTRDDSAAAAPVTNSQDEGDTSASNTNAHARESDTLARTRKELAELDDLDI